MSKINCTLCSSSYINVHLKELTNNFFLFFISVNADCYFLPEHQGKYVTQSTVTREEVSYSEISIETDEINIWGQCYKRINNNVILKMENGEFNCYRCLHLKLVTRNVLRVYTIDEMSKCNTNEEIAIKSCITPHMLNDPTKHTEIILYSKYIHI